MFDKANFNQKAFDGSVKVTYFQSLSVISTQTVSLTKKLWKMLSVVSTSITSLAIKRVVTKVLSTITSRFGHCLSFDGVNDYVNAGNDASLGIENNLTISLWAKLTGTVGIHYTFIVSKKNANWSQSAGYQVYYSSWNNGTLDIMGGGDYFKRHTILQDSLWHYYVIVWEGRILSVYQNGILLSGGYSGTPAAVISGSDNLWIGRRDDANSRYAKGLTDEVRIYNRALSADEIKEHYEGKFTNETGLVGLWHFDEGQGTTATDSSGLGNHGTLLPAGSEPTWENIGAPNYGIVSLLIKNIQGKVLLVVSTVIASIKEQISKTLSIISTSTANLSKRISKTLSIVLISIVSFKKQISKILSVVSTQIVSLKKQISKTLSIISTSIASLSKRISKTLSIISTNTVSLSLLKVITLVVNIISTTTLSLKKFFYRTLSVINNILTKLKFPIIWKFIKKHTTTWKFKDK